MRSSTRSIGYHLEQAYLCLAGLGRPGERGSRLAARGAGLLEVCGRRAYARGDSAAGENLVERAIALLPGGRLSVASASLPLLGRLRRERGHLDLAEALLSEAEERAQVAGLRGVAADARLALVDLRYMATVIAGPVEGEGIAWYQVSTPEGVEGWCDGSYLQTL